MCKGVPREKYAWFRTQDMVESVAKNCEQLNECIWYFSTCLYHTILSNFDVAFYFSVIHYFYSSAGEFRNVYVLVLLEF